MTINNKTGKVITVYNKYFTRDIVIDEIAEITDDELNGDYRLKIRYTTLREELEWFEFDCVKSLSKNVVSLDHYSDIPIALVFDLRGVSEAVFENDDLLLPLLLMCFKKTTLKCIKCVADGNELKNCDGHFLSAKEKKIPLRWLKAEMFFIVPFTIVMIFSAPYDFSTFEAIPTTLFTIFVNIYLFALSAYQIYTYKTVKKWSVESVE